MTFFKTIVGPIPSSGTDVRITTHADPTTHRPTVHEEAEEIKDLHGVYNTCIRPHTAIILKTFKFHEGVSQRDVYVGASTVMFTCGRVTGCGPRAVQFVRFGLWESKVHKNS